MLDQSYTRNEWENFSFSAYQDDALETIRREVANTISANLEPNGFKMKTMSKETRDSIQAIINELERTSI